MLCSPRLVPYEGWWETLVFQEMFVPPKVSGIQNGIDV